MPPGRFALRPSNPAARPRPDGLGRAVLVCGCHRAGSGPRKANGAAMTILDDVERLISRLSPEPLCDDCIAEKQGLSVRQHVNHKTRELAGSNGFERRKDPCSLCGVTKLVIRRH